MTGEEKILRIGGQDIAFKRAGKVLFPEDGLTKQDVLDHYRRVAALMLPHLEERGLTLKRFPDGIGAEGFYQKSIPDHAPDWIRSVTMARTGGGSIDMICARDEATLAWLAGQGTLVIHAPLARADRPERPDQMIFDLDPEEDFTPDVRRAALALRDMLDGRGLKSFVKTSGSRGYHIVVPLRRDHGFDAVKAEALAIAQALERQMPDALTTQFRKAKRGGRIFIDTLRNEYGQTAVAPWSLRARRGAPVATPLNWRELERRSLHPRRYTLGNLARRLAQMSDPWAELPGTQNRLSL